MFPPFQLVFYGTSVLADRLGLCDPSATARMFEQLINKGQSIARVCKGSKADQPPSPRALQSSPRSCGGLQPSKGCTERCWRLLGALQLSGE